MALFEKYPKDIRKMIALSITGAVAIVLIIVMVLINIGASKNNEKGDVSTSKIKEFYNTISEKGALLLN